MNKLYKGILFIISLGLSFVLYQAIIRHMFFIQYFFTVYHKLSLIVLLGFALYELSMWGIEGFKQLTREQVKRLLIIHLVFILVVSIKPVTTRTFSFELTSLRQGISFSYLDFGNLLMYVPVGFMLMSIMKQPVKVLLFSLLGVFILEIFQWITMFGIFDLDDVFLNGLGVLIGILSYFLYQLLIKKAPNNECL